MNIHSKRFRSVRLAYDEAESITEDVKTSQLESLTNSMSELDRVSREVKKIAQEEIAFFSNDLGLLCYLVDDKAERYKTAKVILERNGESVGKDKAKNWVVERDQEMKQALNADKISIQY